MIVQRVDIPPRALPLRLATACAMLASTALYSPHRPSRDSVRLVDTVSEE